MRRRILWINIGLGVLLVAIIGAGLVMLAPRPAELTGRTVSAQLGTVSETVTATGTVQTSGTVDLGFAASGIVAEVLVSEGDVVAEGEEIALLDDTTQRQSLATARSAYVQAVTSAEQSPLTLAQAQRNLTESETNQRINARTYAESVSAAREALADARSSWSESCLLPTGTCPDDSVWAQLRAAEGDVVSAQTAYDQAVQNATKTAETNQVKLGQAQVNVDASRSAQSTTCDTYGSNSSQCISAASTLRSAEQAYALQLQANQAADITAQQSLVNADARVTSTNVALRRLQASLRSSAADSVRTSQNALDTALLNQRKGREADEQLVQAAREALALQQAAQTEVQLGGTPLTTADAAVEVARAGLDAARQALANTRLVSAVAGDVVRVDVAGGDAVTAGALAVTVVPDAPFEIVAEFSEADALKLAVGQRATVSFNALPGTVAAGVVTAVAALPTESAAGAGQTVSGGVTTYEATIALDDVPPSIREGMSVNVVVTTQQVDDVVWVPTAAITTVGGVSTVTIRQGEVDTVVEVTTGLAGDSGTEVTSGVAAGDELVIEIEESTSFTGFGRPPSESRDQ